jgi:hypothetical protein
VKPPRAAKPENREAEELKFRPVFQPKVA